MQDVKFDSMVYVFVFFFLFRPFVSLFSLVYLILPFCSGFLEGIFYPRWGVGVGGEWKEKGEGKGEREGE